MNPTTTYYIDDYYNDMDLSLVSHFDLIYLATNTDGSVLPDFIEF